MECPYCAQELPKDFNKKKIKIERIQKRFQEMQNNCIHIGRPCRLSDGDKKYINKLRDNGMTLKEIAYGYDVSIATIHRAITHPRSKRNDKRN